MKVKAHVYVIKGGTAVLLRPGDTVPAGVKVTNPDAIEADAHILPAPEPEQGEATAPEAEPETQDEAPADEPEAPADEPETQDEAPAESEPAPRKRPSRKATASE